MSTKTWRCILGKHETPWCLSWMIGALFMYICISDLYNQNQNILADNFATTGLWQMKTSQTWQDEMVQSDLLKKTGPVWRFPSWVVMWQPTQQTVKHHKQVARQRKIKVVFLPFLLVGAATAGASFFKVNGDTLLRLRLSVPRLAACFCVSERVKAHEGKPPERKEHAAEALTDGRGWDAAAGQPGLQPGSV